MRSRVASVLNTPRWFANPAYADLAVVADFNADRYALPAMSAELVTSFTRDAVWTSDTTATPGAGGYLYSNIVAQIGSLYAVTYRITNYVGGALQLDCGSAVGGVRTANGTYTDYCVAMLSQTIRFYANVSANYTLDQVSIKEVKLDGSKRLATFDEVFAFSASSTSARTLIDSTGKLTTPPNNLITGSEDLFGWSNNNAAPALNVATAADGTQTAHRLTTVASDGQILSPTLAINGYFIMAVEVKADTKNAAMLVAFDSGNFITPQFSLDTGALIDNTVSGSTFSDVSTGSINLGGGWWKVWTRAKATSTNIGFWLRAPGSTGSILFRHLQFEAVTYETTPRPYYPTTSSPYTSSRRMTYANGKRQLRLENTRTNLLLNSQNFTGTWTNDGTTLGSAIAGPDGSASLFQITENAGTSIHRLYLSSGVSLTAGAAATLSLIFKAGARNRIALSWGGPAFGADFGAKFDLSAGTYIGVYGSGVDSYSITPLAGGLYRLSITKAPGTTSSGVPIIYLLDAAANDNYAGDGASGIYAGYAQAELGAFTSDYIPTTSAAVTRAIETARLSPLVEAILQRAAASIVVRGKLSYKPSAVNSANVGRSIGGAGAISVLGPHSAADNTSESWNGAQALDAVFGTGTIDQPWGLATGKDATGRSLIANGGAIASDANGWGDVSQVYLARGGTVSSNPGYGYGHYDFLGIAPTRLSDTRLQALAVPA